MCIQRRWDFIKSGRKQDEFVRDFFVSSHVCREIGGDFTHDADFLVFEGNHYRNGFMYKSFGMSAIIHEGVKPTLQELEKFEATPEEVEIEGML